MDFKIELFFSGLQVQAAKNMDTHFICMQRQKTMVNISELKEENKFQASRIN